MKYQDKIKKLEAVLKSSAVGEAIKDKARAEIERLKKEDDKPEKKAGSITKSKAGLLSEYEELTDKNNHNEAALLLAKNFGNKSEIGIMEYIVSESKKRGSTAAEDIEIRGKIRKKYFDKLTEEKGKGVKATERKDSLAYYFLHQISDGIVSTHTDIVDKIVIEKVKLKAIEIAGNKDFSIAESKKVLNEAVEELRKEKGKGVKALLTDEPKKDTGVPDCDELLEKFKSNKAKAKKRAKAKPKDAGDTAKRAAETVKNKADKKEKLTATEVKKIEEAVGAMVKVLKGNKAAIRHIIAKLRKLL